MRTSIPLALVLAVGATSAAAAAPTPAQRCAADVELYTWTIARATPSSASKVRAISSSRAWVSTWTVTSSGISR